MAARPWLAAALVGAGSLCFSVMALFVKLAARSQATSTFTIVAIRSALGLGLNAVSLLAHAGAAAVLGAGAAAQATLDPSVLADAPADDGCREANRRIWVWLAVRCLGGFGGVLLEYLALTKLPLAVNTMIVYTNPAFMILWAAALFREPPGPTLVACLGLSLAGLLLIVRPWRLGTSQHAPA